MTLIKGTTAHGFAIQGIQALPEIDGTAYIGIHEASGARLLYLENSDENKSFAIGFRTPPEDDTGVFHILEHSVLCGSDKFPVKEPFVDLLKSSMQTFLNAMTFPDKTLYPVASTNEQDLLNLMDVYMDAVFHPLIYRKRAIFEQEGWHLELIADEPEGDLKGQSIAELPADRTQLIYNGVVYNEMKGALSDASAVLYDEIQRALFPDNCYAFESGGTPEAIPTLTYEGYLDQHRRHYRTDNSYVILYGAMDVDRILRFLDESYLGPLAAEQLEEPLAQDAKPRAIEAQAPIVAPYRAYPMETAPENACAGCGFVIGDATDTKRVIATDILLDALFGSNEAPLKRALLDRAIAHDIQASVADSILQPFVLVSVQMPEAETGSNLATILQEETRGLLDRGLDKNLLEAALSHAEFGLRECDFGIADGVVYAMRSLASWLYDEERPLDYLRYEPVFEELRHALDGDYFEELLKDIFCRCDHWATVEVVPTVQTAPDPTEEKLSELNRDLGIDERESIVAEEKLLRTIQETPDSPKALATLPRLTLADIGAAPREDPFEVDRTHSVPCLLHSTPTHGLAYAYRYFSLEPLDYQTMPYVSILASVLGKLDTAQHSAAELDTLIQAKLGNLSFFVEIIEDKNDEERLYPKFVVSASALGENASWLATLVREVLLETSFEDDDRILDILKQRKIAMEQSFTSAGHSCALARTASYYSKFGVLRESLSNVGFYGFLCDLIANYSDRKGDLVQRLTEIGTRLFSDDHVVFSFGGSEAAYEQFWEAGPQCDRTSGEEERLTIPEPVLRQEAFIVPADVSFAALSWDWHLLGAHFSGPWLVAARALTYDYLWNEVRVKGGAYGVGFQAKRSGALSYYSFRDPAIDRTYGSFEKSVEWLGDFTPDQRALEGFVVATVAGLDAPLKPRASIRRQDQEYFAGYTLADRLGLRQETLQTTGAQLRALAPTLGQAVAQQARCVFGDKDSIESSALPWEIIDLFGSGE